MPRKSLGPNAGFLLFLLNICIIRFCHHCFYLKMGAGESQTPSASFPFPCADGLAPHPRLRREGQGHPGTAPGKREPCHAARGCSAHINLSNPAENDTFNYGTTGGKDLKMCLFFPYYLFALSFSDVLFQVYRNLKNSFYSITGIMWNNRT